MNGPQPVMSTLESWWISRLDPSPDLSQVRVPPYFAAGAAGFAVAAGAAAGEAGARDDASAQHPAAAQTPRCERLPVAALCHGFSPSSIGRAVAAGSRMIRRSSTFAKSPVVSPLLTGADLGGTLPKPCA